MAGARWMSLRVTPAASASAGRAVVHIAVSKRTAPQAVRRNRIKRLIREALRRRARLQAGFLYRIRVDRYPERPGLALVERALDEILK